VCLRTLLPLLWYHRSNNVADVRRRKDDMRRKYQVYGPREMSANSISKIGQLIVYFIKTKGKDFFFFKARQGP
jgi:hypothetical protein